MKLSACVITKNEEENIGTWLASMKKLADEMIVVDTGSTDRTVELAKAAGARVVGAADTSLRTLLVIAEGSYGKG